MGCPDAVVSYLVGLQDVKNVTFNIDNRVFSLSGNSIDRKKLEKYLSIISKQENQDFGIEKYSEMKGGK